MILDESWRILDAYAQMNRIFSKCTDFEYNKKMKIKIAYQLAFAFDDGTTNAINQLMNTEIIEDILIPSLGNVDMQLIESYKVVLIIPNKKRVDINNNGSHYGYVYEKYLLRIIMKEVLDKRLRDKYDNREDTTMSEKETHTNSLKDELEHDFANVKRDDATLDTSLLIPSTSNSSARKLMFGNQDNCDFTAITDERTGLVAFVHKSLVASKDEIIDTYIYSRLKERKNDETMVSIVPTEETSFGIADEYNIVDMNHKILHEDVKQRDLMQLIYDNKYLVISGEKYL